MKEIPILFNTEMVRAILNGRKTQTRRLDKGKQPCYPGDLLYVRETWCKLYYVDPYGYTHYDKPMYYYAADGIPDIELRDADGFLEEDQRIRWKPSIHMPKEAARIWLQVKSVRREKLQDITIQDCHKEGVNREYTRHEISGTVECDFSREAFEELWDSTVKNDRKIKHGWNANPWVWVIQFEIVQNDSLCQYADRDTAQYADCGVLMPAT